MAEQAVHLPIAWTPVRRDGLGRVALSGLVLTDAARVAVLGALDMVGAEVGGWYAVQLPLDNGRRLVIQCRMVTLAAFKKQAFTLGIPLSVHLGGMVSHESGAFTFQLGYRTFESLTQCQVTNPNYSARTGLVVSFGIVNAEPVTPDPVPEPDPSMGPQIMNVDPATGEVGDPLVITVTGYADGGLILIGGEVASIDDIDGDFITVTVPALAAGLHDVTVHNPDGLSDTEIGGFEVIEP